MMIPRSFAYQRRTSKPEGGSFSEKHAGRPVKRNIFPTMGAKTDPTVETMRSPSPPKRAPTSEPAHSQPVSIPTRPHESQTTKVRGQHASRRPQTPTDHKQNAVPPAVAALLAVTSIPSRPQKAQRRRSAPKDRKMSIDELMQEWKKEEKEMSPSSYGSPLDILLERPNDYTSENTSALASPSESPEGLSVRSISSESIRSTTPSLEPDSQSYFSWNSPSTPPKKDKKQLSSVTEECVLDHPLMHYDMDEDDETPLDAISIQSRPVSPKPKSLFKSNLTSSLLAIKSAYKSFSNFTAPSVPPDDLLTGSLLSPRFASEMRPKTLGSFPNPALRRYLNPQSTPHTTPESPRDLFGDSLAPEEENTAQPTIQLQTYERKRTTSPVPRKRRSVDPNSEAGRVLTAGPPVMRQREPRENSDFLRIITMEMNMRREGKLDPRSFGKARIWLPPRRADPVEETTSDSDDVKLSGVPARWVGSSIDAH